MKTRSGILAVVIHRVGTTRSRGAAKTSRAGATNALSAALLSLVLAVPLRSLGAPGDLDPSFGAGGKVTTAVGDDVGAAAVNAIPSGLAPVSRRARSTTRPPPTGREHGAARGAGAAMRSASASRVLSDGPRHPTPRIERRARAAGEITDFIVRCSQPFMLGPMVWREQLPEELQVAAGLRA